MKRILYALLVAVVVSSLAPYAQAQAWPIKPVRLIVAWPAGGGTDLVARIVAQRLSEQIKQPVVVENRSGGSGSIGADLVARAAPDGYTLLLAASTELVVGPAAGQKTPYNPETDFVPVALAGETPLVLVANPATPAKDLASFVVYAKNHPGKLSYGTPGNGSSMQFAGESFNGDVGTSILHVPYRGAAPMLNDLLGNQIPVGIVGMPAVVPHAKAGKLRVLAVTTSKRSALMPDVPTLSELPGMGEYRFSNWMAIVAPAKTPASVVDRLGAEVAKMMQESALRERLFAAGVEPLGLVGKDFESFLTAERKRYRTVAKERGIRFED